MDDVLSASHLGRECKVTCVSSQGLQISGSTVRLTRHAAIFEICGSHSTLLTSEALTDFRLLLRERTIFSGKAVVKNLIGTGVAELCEVELGEGWLDIDGFAALADGDRLRQEFRSYLAEWQRQYNVRPEFKLHIADMQMFFIELRQWLDQVELGLRAAPANSRRELDSGLTAQLADGVVPYVDGLFEKFETLAGELEEDRRPLHRAYMKRQLHPLVLCSPFAHRTFTKPLGYAGDYEMVNMIGRNGHEGDSLFAKVVNCWFLAQPPARAHRNRIEYLTRRLVDEAVRIQPHGRPLRVFNLACGPALEVQSFLRESSVSNQTDISLLDFNQETLDYTSGVLEELKRRHSRSTGLHFIKRSIHHLLKESGKSTERVHDSRYDLVYCAGLFDYLTDAVCRRLMTIMYRWLTPGGLLLATNVDSCNPLRQGMDYLLDWNLIHRTAKQSLGLCPVEVPSESVSVKSDLTGVNLFIELRKPEDA